MEVPIIIKNALPVECCALLSSYARFKANIHPNAIKSNDPLKGIHREYGDPLMETLLEQFTPMIERAVGCELWPTLSFYYVYKSKNHLQKHVDRSSCEIVASLCIDADDAFKDHYGTWPLFLDVQQGSEKSFSVNYGDLLLFPGHKMAHWREAFQGQWFVSAIFAYVRKNGPYAFQRYDQRKMLGRPHVGMFRWSWGCIKQSLIARTR